MHSILLWWCNAIWNASRMAAKEQHEGTTSTRSKSTGLGGNSEELDSPEDKPRQSDESPKRNSLGDLYMSLKFKFLKPLTISAVQRSSRLEQFDRNPVDRFDGNRFSVRFTRRIRRKLLVRFWRFSQLQRKEVLWKRVFEYFEHRAGFDRNLVLCLVYQSCRLGKRHLKTSLSDSSIRSFSKLSSGHSTQRRH